MKRGLVLLLVGLAACSSNSAPAGPPPALVTPTMLQPPPVYALIGHRDRLQLSGEQIESLDSIAIAVEAENAPLIDSLMAQGTPTRGATGMLVVDEGRQILEQIRENHRGAASAVGTVLTEQQQTQACDLFRLNRERRTSRPRVRGGDPAAADSILRAMESRVWPWCGQQAAADGEEEG